VDKDDGFVVSSLPDDKDMSVSKTCNNDDENCGHTMFEVTNSGHSVADKNMQHTLSTNESASDNVHNSHTDRDIDVDTRIITKEDRTSIDGQVKNANVEIDTRSASCSVRSEELFKSSTPPNSAVASVASGYGQANQFPLQEQVPDMHFPASLSGASIDPHTPVTSYGDPVYVNLMRNVVHTPVDQQPVLDRELLYEDPYKMSRRQLDGARGDLIDTAMPSPLTQQSHNITQNQGTHSVNGR